MFGRQQKQRLAAREEEVREARGKLAEGIVELGRARSHVEDMVKNALERVEKVNRRASPPSP